MKTLIIVTTFIVILIGSAALLGKSASNWVQGAEASQNRTLTEALR